MGNDININPLKGNASWGSKQQQIGEDQSMPVDEQKYDAGNLGITVSKPDWDLHGFLAVNKQIDIIKKETEVPFQSRTDETLSAEAGFIIGNGLVDGYFFKDIPTTYFGAKYQYQRNTTDFKLPGMGDLPWAPVKGLDLVTPYSMAEDSTTHRAIIMQTVPGAYFSLGWENVSGDYYKNSYANKFAFEKNGALFEAAYYGGFWAGSQIAIDLLLHGGVAKLGQRGDGGLGVSPIETGYWNMKLNTEVGNNAVNMTGLGRYSHVAGFSAQWDKTPMLESTVTFAGYGGIFGNILQSQFAIIQNKYPGIEGADSEKDLTYDWTLSANLPITGDRAFFGLDKIEQDVSIYGSYTNSSKGGFFGGSPEREGQVGIRVNIPFGPWSAEKTTAEDIDKLTNAETPGRVIWPKKFTPDGNVMIQSNTEEAKRKWLAGEVAVSAAHTVNHYTSMQMDADKADSINFERNFNEQRPYILNNLAMVMFLTQLKSKAPLEALTTKDNNQFVPFVAARLNISEEQLRNAMSNPTSEKAVELTKKLKEIKLEDVKGALLDRSVLEMISKVMPEFSPELLEANIKDENLDVLVVVKDTLSKPFSQASVKKEGE